VESAGWTDQYRLTSLMNRSRSSALVGLEDQHKCQGESGSAEDTLESTFVVVDEWGAVGLARAHCPQFDAGPSHVPSSPRLRRHVQPGSNPWYKCLSFCLLILSLPSHLASILYVVVERERWHGMLLSISNTNDDSLGTLARVLQPRIQEICRETHLS